MNKSEFEKRVQMNVTSSEYAAIEEVYMNSDLDKDEFCKVWVKMNKTRVNKARQEARDFEIEQERRMTLWGIIDKYFRRDYQWKVMTIALDVLTKKERKAVLDAGIHLETECYYCNIKDVLYGISEYLEKAA